MPAKRYEVGTVFFFVPFVAKGCPQISSEWPHYFGHWISSANGPRVGDWVYCPERKGFFLVKSVESLLDPPDILSLEVDKTERADDSITEQIMTWFKKEIQT